jgi:prepilin-type N-terminal cleavage/methylation domain-containing protein
MKTHMRDHQAGFTLIEYIVTLVIAAIVATMIYTFFGSALTNSGTPITRLTQSTNLQKVMENIVADYKRLNALNLRYRWQPSIAYKLDSIVTPTTIPAAPNGGHYYKCTTAGTSGASEPTWSTSGTISDGTIVWTVSSGNISVWQKSNAYAAGNIVVPINNNGHYYKCQTGGTSGTSVPTWLTSGTISDGTVVWTEDGTILNSSDSSLTDNLSYYLTNNPARYGTGYTVVGAETKFIQFDGTNTQVDAGTSEKNILKLTIQDNSTSQTLTELFTIR